MTKDTKGGSDKESGVNLTQEQLELIRKTWPENFGCLFEMGQLCFEKAFDKHPTMKDMFQFKDDNWKKDERFKRVILGFEQTLVQGVTVFCDPKAVKQETDSVENYCKYVEEVGGLHKGILPNMDPKLFDHFFDIAPTVIVESIEKRSKNLPFDEKLRKQLYHGWKEMCSFILKHIMIGWEKSVVPQAKKLKKAYQKKTMSVDNIESENESGDEAKQHRAPSVGATHSIKQKKSASGK